MNIKQWAAGLFTWIFVCPMIGIGIVACTSTPQGRALDMANYQDMGTTAGALAMGYTEANPVGLALIPIKLGMGRVVEKHYANDCVELSQASNILSTPFKAAAVSNLALMCSVPYAPVVGIGYGIYKWLNRPEYLCLAGNACLDNLAAAYANGDLDSFSALFTPTATTTDATGRESIRLDYQRLFATTHHRSIKWRKYDPETGVGDILVEVDGKFFNLELTVEYEGERISKFEWVDL